MQKVSLGTTAISLLLLKPSNSLIIGTKSSKLLKLSSPYTEVSKSLTLKLNQVECLSQGEDDHFWASGSFETSQNHSIYYFSSNLEELFKYSGHSDAIIGLAFIKINLFSASEDRTVQFWSKSHESSTILYEHEAPIITFDGDPVDEMLASADNSYKLEVFSIKEKKIVFSQCLDEKVWTLKFLKGKKKLLCGDQEGSLICFDLDKKSKDFQLSAHESRIRTISVYQDFVVAGSFDCGVSVWNWKNERKIKDFLVHSDWVRAVFIDQKNVFSVADDSFLCVHVFQEEKNKDMMDFEDRLMDQNNENHRKVFECQANNYFDKDFQRDKRDFFSFREIFRNFWVFLIFNSSVSKVYKEIDPEDWKKIVWGTIGLVFVGVFVGYFTDIGWVVLVFFCAVVASMVFYFKVKKPKPKFLSV